MSNTPKTDALEAQLTSFQGTSAAFRAVITSHFNMERELAEARARIEDMLKGDDGQAWKYTERNPMATVYENRGGEVWERHADGRRELFAADIITRLTTLERELAEAREQWRMSSVCRELAEQRDRLVAALESILTNEIAYDREHAFSGTYAKEALAAVKGG